MRCVAGTGALRLSQACEAVTQQQHTTLLADMASLMRFLQGKGENNTGAANKSPQVGSATSHILCTMCPASGAGQNLSSAQWMAPQAACSSRIAGCVSPCMHMGTPCYSSCDAGASFPLTLAPCASHTGACRWAAARLPHRPACCSQGRLICPERHVCANQQEQRHERQWKHSAAIPLSPHTWPCWHYACPAWQ